MEILETGMEGKLMVYVEEAEKKLIDRLFRLKPPTGTYYRKGAKFAYHWLLHPLTVAKLRLKQPVIKLPPE